MIKGILFDFDGTIVNSEESRFESLKYVLKEEGVDFLKEEWDETFKALGSVDVLNFIKKREKKTFDSNQLYDKSHKYRLKYEKEKGVRIIEGFREFYDKLKKRGIKCMICTGGKTTHLKYVCKIAKIEIEGFGREHYGYRKPAPDCYLEGLKRINLKAQEVLVFDDSNSGLEAAKNAKIKSIAINCLDDLKGLDVIKSYKNYNQIDLDWLLEL